jgi:hypothetical protein
MYPDWKDKVSTALAVDARVVSTVAGSVGQEVDKTLESMVERSLGELSTQSTTTANYDADNARYYNKFIIFWNALIPGNEVQMVDEQSTAFWILFGLLPSLQPHLRHAGQVEAHLRGVSRLHEIQAVTTPTNPRTHPRGKMTDGIKVKLTRKHNERRELLDMDKGIGRMDGIFFC